MERCDYGHSYQSLKVYPNPILPLTTLSLLISFTSSVATVMPAMTSLNVPEAKVEVGVVMIAPKEVHSEDYQPITDPKNVEKFLNDYFADIPLLAKIGKCESYNRHLNSRGEILRGQKNTYDRGVMQINVLYHEETAEKMGLDIHNIDGNVAFVRHLYEKYGAKPWASSSACWSKFLGPGIARK